MRRLACLVLLAVCGEDAAGPAPIALGEDACDHCRMIISEAPFAAQARFDGKVEKYDDIGCMLERLRRGASPRELWVTDRNSGLWINARAAFYVQSEDLKTPMASGMAAVGGRADADALAGRVKGKVLSFQDLRR